MVGHKKQCWIPTTFSSHWPDPWLFRSQNDPKCRLVWVGASAISQPLLVTFSESHFILHEALSETFSGEMFPWSRSVTSSISDTANKNLQKVEFYQFLTICTRGSRIAVYIKTILVSDPPGYSYGQLRWLSSWLGLNILIVSCLSLSD